MLSLPGVVVTVTVAGGVSHIRSSSSNSGSSSSSSGARHTDVCFKPAVAAPTTHYFGLSFMCDIWPVTFTSTRTYAADCQLLAISYLHSTKHLLDFTLRINNTNHDTINFSVIKYICTELFNQSIDYKYFVTPRRSSSSNSGSSSSSSWRQTHCCML